MSDEFFFVFKKLVSLFLFPMPVIVAMLLIGVALLWFSKKQWAGKAVVTLGVIGLTLVSFKPLPNGILASLEHSHRPYALVSREESGKTPPRIEFVVVLAGGHVRDSSMPVTSQLSSATLVRLVEGIRIYRKHPGSKLVVDGWGMVVSTAHLMEQLAVELGVPRADIIMEPRSKDTKDEARLIKAIVGSAPFILVTAASHMPRAMAMFEKQGMHPLPAPTGHRVRRRTETRLADFFPSGGTIRKAETVVYEYLAWTWAKLRGQL